MEIFFYIGGLAVLYFVIQAAVTAGINNSVIGKFLKKDSGENVTIKEVLLKMSEEKGKG